MTTYYTYNIPPIDVLHRRQSNGGREADTGYVVRRNVRLGEIGCHNRDIQGFGRDRPRKKAREQLYYDNLIILPGGLGSTPRWSRGVVEEGSPRPCRGPPGFLLVLGRLGPRAGQLGRSVLRRVVLQPTVVLTATCRTTGDGHIASMKLAGGTGAFTAPLVVETLADRGTRSSGSTVHPLPMVSSDSRG